jgi:predicted transcriptional regulator of viral defense system
MKFDELQALVQSEPVFETGFLLAGDVDPVNVRKQLSRWKQTGRVLQLRRGLYTLAPPYQKLKPHPFLVANRLAPGSYVSLQAALAHYGLIPEYVPVVTSVGASRPRQWTTPIGTFMLRHIKPDLLFGYERVQVTPSQGTTSQSAFIAAREKALLDLLYLEPHSATPAYIHELRLQNLASLNLERLRGFAEVTGSPKLQAATALIEQLATQVLGYVDHGSADQGSVEL